MTLIMIYQLLLVVAFTQSKALIIRLPEGYFEQICQPKMGLHIAADFCFIVQTPCIENRIHVLASIKKDIRNIMTSSSKNASRFTIVTYDAKAKSAVDWTKYESAKHSKYFESIGRKCGCKARTHKALQMCKRKFEYLKTNDVGVHKLFPKNIIIFTDGISFDRKGNMERARNKTITEALKIMEDKSYNVQVIKILTGQAGDDRTGEDEWEVLNRFPFRIFWRHRDLGFGRNQQIGISYFTEQKQVSESLCCTADVIFVSDSSKNIDTLNVITVFDFLSLLLGKIRIKILTPDIDDRTRGFQIGLMTYGSEVNVHAHLGQYGYTGLIGAIRSMNREQTPYRHTHKALA